MWAGGSLPTAESAICGLGFEYHESPEMGGRWCFADNGRDGDWAVVKGSRFGWKMAGEGIVGDGKGQGVVFTVHCMYLKLHCFFFVRTGAFLVSPCMSAQGPSRVYGIRRMNGVGMPRRADAPGASRANFPTTSKGLFSLGL